MGDTRFVEVSAGPVSLGGTLAAPFDAEGLVIFAHGSGSSRHSPRNQLVASHLNNQGMATLLFDLLTPEEELDRSNVFDIPMLGARLALATEWARGEVTGLPIGYFGASTGAAAALVAASELGPQIEAVVSRGGRSDLAREHLPHVVSPTLLIVGGNDRLVLELNHEAAIQMKCDRKLAVVPGAMHLFEEPGALERVAEMAGSWFSAHLGAKAAA